jgi:hypothetical protein
VQELPRFGGRARGGDEVSELAGVIRVDTRGRSMTRHGPSVSSLVAATVSAPREMLQPMLQASLSTPWHLADATVFASGTPPMLQSSWLVSRQCYSPHTWHLTESRTDRSFPESIAMLQSLPRTSCNLSARSMPLGKLRIIFLSRSQPKQPMCAASERSCWRWPAEGSPSATKSVTYWWTGYGSGGGTRRSLTRQIQHS